MLEELKFRNQIVYAVEETQKLVSFTQHSVDSSLALIDKLSLLVKYLHYPNIRIYIIFSWWVLCFNLHILLWFLPLLVSGLLWFRIKKTPSAERNYSEYLNEKRVNSTVNLISELNLLWRQFKAWMLDIEELLPATPEKILDVTLVALPVWWIVLYIFSLKIIVASSGTLVILETSAVHRQLRSNFLKYFFIQLKEHFNLKTIKNKTISSFQETIFLDKTNPISKTPKLLFSSVNQFKPESLRSLLETKYSAEEVTLSEKQFSITQNVFENQRNFYWYGWQSPHYNTDPSAWTNEQGAFSLSKTLIELPSPIIRPLNKEEIELFGDNSIYVCFYWIWEDEWRTIYNSLTDYDGWSYGDTNWKNFSAQSKGWYSSPNTRRRSWQRRANLYRIYFH